MSRASLAAASFLALFLVSCAGGTPLRAAPVADRQEIKGTFSLILFGGNYSDDLETAAIFDAGGDGYEIRPFAAEFRYKILKGLSAEDAFAKAYDHVSYHPEFSGTRLKKILGPEGGVIGYELRPLYAPFIYGGADVMEISYSLNEGGKVNAVIRLKERVWRKRMGDGDTIIRDR